MEKDRNESPKHLAGGGNEVAAPELPQDLGKVEAVATESGPDPRAPGPESGQPLGRFFEVPEGRFLVHDAFGIGGASTQLIADYPKLAARQK